jgi:hypothetical protein
VKRPVCRGRFSYDFRQVERHVEKLVWSRRMFTDVLLCCVVSSLLRYTLLTPWAGCKIPIYTKQASCTAELGQAADLRAAKG